MIVIFVGRNLKQFSVIGRFTGFLLAVSGLLGHPSFNFAHLFALLMHSSSSMASIVRLRLVRTAPKELAAFMSASDIKFFLLRLLSSSIRVIGMANLFWASSLCCEEPWLHPIVWYADHSFPIAFHAFGVIGTSVYGGDESDMRQRMATIPSPIVADFPSFGFSAF
jgi:hypothetical protein